MNYVINVSFPRSGHHALVRCLMELLNGELHYCDYYRHCQQIPCSDPSTNYQKSHDFDLSLPVEESIKYIVQFRTPIEAITSWYQYKFGDPYTRSGDNWVRKLINRSILGNNRLHWEFFFRNKFKYWVDFAEKWLEHALMPNVLIVRYHDFLQNPSGTLSDVLEFAAFTEIPSSTEIQRIVLKQKIEKKRNIREFRYFSSSQFRNREDSIAQILLALELPRVMR